MSPPSGRGRPPFDPYAALGVARDAPAADIRSAYRHLALAHHPDKATARGRGGGDDEPGGARDEAPSDDARFAEIAAAYALLGDPAARAAHDAAAASGGSLDLADMAVDFSRLGVLDAALLSVFAKLGVAVRAAPPPALLDAARLGLLEPRPLPLDARPPAAGCVARGEADWWAVELPSPAPPGGVAFAAYSRSGSRCQLLMFERAASGHGGGWELAAAADSAPVAGGGQLAALFCGLPFATWDLPPPKSGALAAAAGASPASRVLRRLDGLAPREPLPAVAGPVLLAVVGSNVWKRSAYSVRAASVPASGAGDATAAPSRDPGAALRAAEDAILARRRALGDLDAAHRAAEAALKRVADDVVAAGGELDALLAARDAAYLDMMGLLPGA